MSPGEVMFLHGIEDPLSASRPGTFFGTPLQRHHCPPLASRGVSQRMDFIHKLKAGAYLQRHFCSSYMPQPLRASTFLLWPPEQACTVTCFYFQKVCENRSLMWLDTEVHFLEKSLTNIYFKDQKHEVLILLPPWRWVFFFSCEQFNCFSQHSFLRSTCRSGVHL